MPFTAPRPADDPAAVAKFDDYLARLREMFLQADAAEWSVESGPDFFGTSVIISTAAKFERRIEGAR